CRSCQTPYALREGDEGMKCDNCGGELYQRDDDAPVAVRRRIEVYNAQTIPVLDFYRDRGVLVDISGDETVDEVNKQVLTALSG
ncbi:MAG: adenylate kinase, partial [Chloroflexota bacterium]|nr:adenylate kinase [Chloroflexota bacterium]